MLGPIDMVEKYLNKGVPTKVSLMFPQGSIRIGYITLNIKEVMGATLMCICLTVKNVKINMVGRA